VRDLILEHLRRHRTAGLGDPEDHRREFAGAFNPALLREIRDEARRLNEALAKPT